MSATAMNPSANTDPFDWLTPRRFGVALALWLAVIFPAIILGTGTFALRDYGLFTAPMAQFHREMFWNGEVPLWNPYSHCGIPFLAQWNTSALYPPSLLYLLLPMSWGLGLLGMFHLWIAGMGMFLLAERYAGNRLAAAVAGMVFAWNGLSLSCLFWISNLGALAWMPWMLLALERGVREGGKWLRRAVIIGAMQMLSGAPEIILLTWLVAIGPWLASLVREPRSVVLVRVRRWLVVVALVAGLSAAQLLPFMELLQQSSREGSQIAAMWPMPALGWANLVVPQFHVFPSATGALYQYDQYWTSSYFVGGFALVLAGVGLIRGIGRRRWYWAGVALGGLILALGPNAGVLNWLQQHVPGLGLFRYPIKMVVLPVFAIPLLAALGVKTVVLRWNEKPLRRALLVGWIGFLLIAAFVVWFGETHPMPQDVPGALRQNAFLVTGCLSGALLLLAGTILKSRERAGRLLSVLLLGLVWWELWAHVPLPHAVLPSSVLQPDLVVQRLGWEPRPALGESRVLVHPLIERQLFSTWQKEATDSYLIERAALFLNVNLLERIPTAHGFFSLYPRYTDAVLSEVYGVTTDPSPGFADFIGARFAQEPAKPFEFIERKSAHSWITAGQAVVFTNGNAALKRMLSPGFDSASTVYLRPEAEALVGVRSETSATVSNVTFGVHRVTATVKSVQPSIMVIAQSWYPGWTAWVNGVEAPVIRANVAFQAVPVPAGKSSVTLEFRNRPFRIGATISGISLLALVAWCFVGMRRRTDA